MGEMADMSMQDGLFPDEDYDQAFMYDGQYYGDEEVLEEREPCEHTDSYSMLHPKTEVINDLEENGARKRKKMRSLRSIVRLLTLMRHMIITGSGSATLNSPQASMVTGKESTFSSVTIKKSSSTSRSMKLRSLVSRMQRFQSNQITGIMSCVCIGTVTSAGMS